MVPNIQCGRYVFSVRAATACYKDSFTFLLPCFVYNTSVWPPYKTHLQNFVLSLRLVSHWQREDTVIQLSQLVRVRNLLRPLPNYGRRLHILNIMSTYNNILYIEIQNGLKFVMIYMHERLIQQVLWGVSGSEMVTEYKS
jgi:hypothetical protein